VPGVVGEPEHGMRLVPQTFQQVAGGGLFSSRGAWMVGQADGDAVVERFEVQQQGLGRDLVNLTGPHAQGLGVQAGQRPADLLVPFLVGEVLFGRGEFADAYALLAAPYRDAVTLAAFTKACQASPILAEARAVTLNRLRQQTVGTAATVEGSGVLDSRSGGVPIAFVFLQEGGNLRILVVSLAGVPVLQGVAAR